MNRYIVTFKAIKEIVDIFDIDWEDPEVSMGIYHAQSKESAIDKCLIDFNADYEQKQSCTKDFNAYKIYK